MCVIPVVIMYVWPLAITTLSTNDKSSNTFHLYLNFNRTAAKSVPISTYIKKLDILTIKHIWFFQVLKTEFLHFINKFFTVQKKKSNTTSMMEPDSTCDSSTLNVFEKNKIRSFQSSTITAHETFENVVGVDMEIVNKKNPCKCDELKKEKLLLAKKLEECYQECRNLLEEKDKIIKDLRHEFEITKQRDPKRMAIQDKIHVEKFVQLSKTCHMNYQLNIIVDDIIEDLKSKLLLADIGADKISDKRLLLNSISGTIFRFIFKKLMSRFPLLEQKYNSLNLNLEKNLLVSIYI